MSSHQASAQETARVQPLPQSNVPFAPHLPSQITSFDDLRARVSERRANHGMQGLKHEKSTRSAAGSQAHRTRKRYAEQSTSGPGHNAFVSEHIMQSLLDKIKQQLPVYSGLTLDDLANHPTLTATIQIFCSLAAPSAGKSQTSSRDVSESSSHHGLCPSTSTLNSFNYTTPHKMDNANYLARGLCELIESLNEIHASPVQILHSQIFLLKILLRFLAERTSESYVRIQDPGSSSNLIQDISTHITNTQSLHFPPDLTPITTPSDPFADSTAASVTDTRLPRRNSLAFSNISSVNTNSSFLDPGISSRILSILLRFISRNDDFELIGHSTDTQPHPVGSLGQPSPQAPSYPAKYSTPPLPSLFRSSSLPHSTVILSGSQTSSPSSKQPSKLLLWPKSPGSPTFSPLQFPSPRLTPPPSIPLHGFEDFSPPALHLPGAGLLCPGVVWEHGANPQLHPTITTRSRPDATSTGTGTYVRPYTSLYTHLDKYPPTLCFLPPSTLLARYAARCVYFLSKAESAEEQFNDAVVAGGVQNRSVKDRCEVVWERITSAVKRLAGETLDASLARNSDGSGCDEFVTNTNGVATAGVEKEAEKDTQKLKQSGSQRSTLRESGSKTRRGTMIASIWNLPAVNAPGESPTGESRNGEDSGQPVNQYPRPIDDIAWLGEEDVTELSLLGFVAMRKGKLSSIMTQLASLLLNMSGPTRGAAGAAIRAGIFAWLEDAPTEFVRLAGGDSSVYSDDNQPAGPSDVSYPRYTRKAKKGSQIHASGERIEGAERLLELMTSLAKDDYNTDLKNDNATGGSSLQGAGQQARVLLWTGVGALFCICTDRVREAEVDHTNALFTTMARYLHSPGPNVDIALRFYSDICRAAFFIPPYRWMVGDKKGVEIEINGTSGYGKQVFEGGHDAGECPLSAVAREVVEELFYFFERNPPYKAHAIDTSLYTDALVAIYRFLPHRAVDLIRVWLAPKCGNAVKFCVVQAALRLVVEAQVFPWQPSLDAFVECSSRPLNTLLRSLLRDADDGASSQPSPPFPLRTDVRTLRRTLLLSLQGLLRLDIAFGLCGPSVSDLAEISRVGVRIPGPPRDSGVLIMSFAMHAAWIEGARRVLREGARLRPHDEDANSTKTRLYKDARNYLRANLYTTLFTMSQQLVDVWSNTENLLCILGVKYILAILTDSCEDDEDVSWRYVKERFPALAMTKIALLSTVKSSDPAILHPAIECLSLLARAHLDSNAPSPPVYYAHYRDPAFRRFLVSLAAAQPPSSALGQVAIQKLIRDGVSGHSLPCALHFAGWRECYFRWKTLCSVVRSLEAEARFNPGLQVGPGTMEERQAEWTNYGLALAKSAVCENDIDFSLFEVLGNSLPDRRLQYYLPKELVYRFVRDMVELLNADTFHFRETAKQALGTELHQMAIPELFKQFNMIIPELLKNVDVSFPQENEVLFLNNCVGVLSLLVDRIDNVDALLVCDVGPIILPLSHFLDLRIASITHLRARTQFCGVIQMILKRGDIFTFRQDFGTRQILLDITIGWASVLSTTVSPEHQPTPEYVRWLCSCQAVALQTASELCHNLRLQPLEDTTKMDSRNVVSRIFHRYLMAFIRGLGLGKAEDVDQDSMLGSQSTSLTLNDKPIQESVIVGITNLINANTDIGFKQCLMFGYDNDPCLRAIFMEVFSRLLKLGTRFESRDNLRSGSLDGQLCEIVRNSEILVDSMMTVCSTSEIDTVTSVLLNIFDTRQAILSLAQRLVAREINEAGSSTNFFRENTLTNHVLSAIVKQYGYRYLRTVLEPVIKRTLHALEDTSLELDPAKLQDGEDLDNNQRLVSDLAQSLIDGIIASGPRIPSIIIDICHYIFTMAIESYPDTQYSAVGGFLFLRFFCPAIASPESIDIEVPLGDSHTKTQLQRVLLVLAKILQTLSNNFMFGKEVHLLFLNPFLDSNITSVADFLDKTFFLKSVEIKDDQWLGLTYDDTDTLILHQFFHRHYDDIGRLLLSGARNSNNNAVTLHESTTIWKQVCEIRTGLDPTINFGGPSLTTPADIVQFEQYLMKNAHRNRDPVRHILYPCEDCPDVFILRHHALNVETVDLQLLRYHLFCTLKENFTSHTDGVVVLDYTMFRPMAELPVDWLKDGLGIIPAVIRDKIRALYILNANALTQRFYQKFFLVCSETYLASEVHAVSSVSELFEHIGYVESIWKSSTGILENEPSQVFKNVYQRYVPHRASAVTFEVRESHLRIISLKPQEITARICCKTVEIVPLDEVNDIYKLASEPDSDLQEFVISRSKRGATMQFASLKRNAIVKAIQAAKSRADCSSLHTLHEFSGLSDITVMLLAIGIINTCHEQDWVGEAASVLLAAICSYHNYEGISAVLPAMSTSYILNSPGALVLFSERLSSFMPHITLEFIMEFHQGFNKASIGQKMECLSYLAPWIRNIPRFATPGDLLYDQSGGKLRDAIHSLCDISLRDRAIYQRTKEFIWVEFTNMSILEGSTLDLVADELIRLAVDSGIDSLRCHLIVDAMMTITSIQVRAHTIYRLRQALRKKSLSKVTTDTDDTVWNEVAILLRLTLAASYNADVPTQNQLFISEIVHVITMVAASGPLEMRKSVYGLFLNLIHSLTGNRIPHGIGTPEYQAMVSGPATAKLFGLSLPNHGMGYDIIRYSGEQRLDGMAVEEISKILLRVIEGGIKTGGYANVVKARWMSLVVATAFQSPQYMQVRAFTVLGVLVKDNLNNDLLHQILHSLKVAMQHSPGGNCIAVISMLRCMSKLIPDMNDSPIYLCGVFWMAIAFLQTAHLSYYVESIHLIRAVLEKLEAQSAFWGRSISSVLLRARSFIAKEVADFDDISGLSFRDELSFSLSTAFLLYAVAQHQKLRPIVGEVLRIFLRVLSRNPHEEEGVRMVTRVMDPTLIGFFIGLLPFCATVASLRTLLEETKVDVPHWESKGLLFNGKLHEGYKCAVPFSLLGVSDVGSVQLIVGFIASMLDSRLGNVSEREILYCLLSDTQDHYPVIVSQSQRHYLTSSGGSRIQERINRAYSWTPSQHILSEGSKLLLPLLTTREECNPNASSSTLSTLSHDEYSPTSHFLALEELGMSGLVTHSLDSHRTESTEEDFVTFSPLFADLIERILEG